VAILMVPVLRKLTKIQEDLDHSNRTMRFSTIIDILSNSKPFLSIEEKKKIGTHILTRNH